MIRLKRGTEAQITETSPVPFQLEGEIAYSTDDKQIYVSDGSSFLQKTFWVASGADITYSGGNISIDSNKKVYLDGGTNTYLIYNSTTSKVEIYVGGVKKASWG